MRMQNRRKFTSLLISTIYLLSHHFIQFLFLSHQKKQICNVWVQRRFQDNHFLALVVSQPSQEDEEHRSLLKENFNGMPLHVKDSIYSNIQRKEGEVHQSCWNLKEHAFVHTNLIIRSFKLSSWTGMSTSIGRWFLAIEAINTAERIHWNPMKLKQGKIQPEDE